MPSTRSQNMSKGSERSRAGTSSATTDSSAGATCVEMLTKATSASIESSTGSTSMTGTVSTRTATTARKSSSAGIANASRPAEDEHLKPRQKKRSSRPFSPSRKNRSKELAEARAELLRIQMKLAAMRVASLESDDDSDDDDQTLREERTSTWIVKSAQGLKSNQHNNDAARTTIAPAALLAEPPTGNRIIETETYHVYTPPPPYEERPTHPASQPTPIRREQASPSINYRELTEAIPLAARAQPALRYHELPVFSGASSEWLPFKTAYEETSNLLAEQDNLARLRRSLKGIAKDAVQCLFIRNTTTAEIMKLLASRFGRPDSLVMAELNKLQELPRLSQNPRDLCIFASKILNITATVKALNKPQYLYNAEVVRGVVEKLPSALRYLYYDFVAEQPEGQPDLITLAKFFQRTAERCGNFASAEVIASEDRREAPYRRAAKNFHAAEQSTAHESTHDRRVNRSVEKRSCRICNREGHQTSECRTFKDAEVSKRWVIAKEHKLCYRCLRYRKFPHKCKAKPCGVNGCTSTHHSLLHNSLDPPTVTETSTQTDVVTSAKDNETSALLKILPVQISGPTGTYDTYALLNDGSTCSIIEKSVAEKVGATGPLKPFFIENVTGTRIDVLEANWVRFHIRGPLSKNYEISARTMRDLRVSPQSISRRLIKTCGHLKTLDENRISYKIGKPTILIGQDNWHLLLAHEVHRGGRYEPVASRTDLGWVVHGTHRGPQRHRSTRLHHIRATEADIAPRCS